MSVVPLSLPLDADGYFVLRESVGLSHETQILVLPWPEGMQGDFLLFHDVISGQRFAGQRSHQNPKAVFVSLNLPAYGELRLRPEPAKSVEGLSVESSDSRTLISQKHYAVEVIREARSWECENHAPGPILRMRTGTGAWRGGTYLDTRRSVEKITTDFEEQGPLRVVVRYRAELTGGQFYQARLTFDEPLPFVRIDEEFQAGSGDQIVWDFTGKDMPSCFHALDSSAAYTTQPVSGVFDRRLARLACWNQFSQLFDFSDGFAISFATDGDDDVLGFLTLDGGNWEGNSHNFLEAWERRWWPGDRDSRRMVPPEAKADATPSPEYPPSRQQTHSEAHFCVEGWINEGRRSSGLVLTSVSSIRPADEHPSSPLGHFEDQPDRARYRAQQSALRGLQIQHGVFPLTAQLQMTWDWPPEARVPSSSKTSPRAQAILDFLETRVFGFWEGSGMAYSNPVVSRPLAVMMQEWEQLIANGEVTLEDISTGRRRFAFLTDLFCLETYYPGDAAMNPENRKLSLEPSFAGMANQNFFTDVINVAGMAAQVFWRHPRAEAWRERFGTMWQRQLSHHVYPESGVWEESHTYFHHVLLTVLPTLERRRDDGVEDGFANPDFQKTVAFLLKTLTPSVTQFGGHRYTLALGDHGMDTGGLYTPIYRRLALGIFPHDPVLAGCLATAYRELGGQEDLDLPLRPLPWHHEYVQGLGYFFRSESSRGQSLVVLRCGSAWAHHHNDEGSLQFFAAGRAWIVDSAFGHPQVNGQRKVQADGHSRWTPRDFSPLDYFWQFNRGWICEHEASTPLPFARAYSPIQMAAINWRPGFSILPRPVQYQRTMVQLSAEMFLIIDQSDADIPQVVRFHIPQDAPFALEEEPAPGVEHYLRIRNLQGDGRPLRAGFDAPIKNQPEFATVEVRYDFSGKAPILFLLEIAGSEATQVERREKGCLLRHPCFELDIQFADQISITDLASGEVLNF